MGEAGLGKRGQVLREDGYKGLISLLPPPPRRAAVLIDPPYEEKQDYRRVTETLKAALKRFESGCYLIWYPCLSREESRKLPEELKNSCPTTTFTPNCTSTRRKPTVSVCTAAECS